MLPRLSKRPGLSADVEAYIAALKHAGFQGECETGYSARLTMATDNSLYQFLPQAVLFPHTTEDVVLIASIAGRERFRAITFAPRGGGTGTNGQSLTTGIVVDLSRHMNKILTLNLEEGWVEVEAGVIKDQLNRYLKPYGYFFSPDLSTSNRATLGGMINTDASGQGSLVYGKTSDHVLSLQAVLIGGEQIVTQSAPVTEVEQLLKEKEGLAAKVYRAVYELCRDHRALIEDKFPKLNRFLTGYDLKHVFNDDLSAFDLGRILTGSEGTLAFITTARLNITPLPKIRRLVCITYNSFDAALRHASFLLEAKALSVETIDSHVLDLARQDIIWHQVRDLIEEVPARKIAGLNIVEFAGSDEDIIDQHLSSLLQRLRDAMSKAERHIVLGYQVCCDLDDIERIYTMRKKAVGLLGNMPGPAKPVAFVEDTCVPPHHLADYITEFRALLDRHHLSYGMFGHVDAGVLHVRPALDMTDPAQQKLVKTLSDQVVELTRKYNGLLWGEHGKGVRGEYSKDFFGEELYGILQKIKSAFDPYNQLNPGKICAPDPTLPLLGVESPMRGMRDQHIPIDIRQTYQGAMTCNGNGLCFNFDTYTPMCPSMKVSGDRIHSPKGRAALMREWLYLLVETGGTPQDILAGEKSSLRLINLVYRLKNSLEARKGVYDFSHEVKEAMAGCLSCKACATQCPVKIDVPSFKVLFFQAYYQRYLHPLRDYALAAVEYYTPFLARAPWLFNSLTQRKFIQHAVEKYISLVDLPALSTPSLRQRLEKRKEKHVFVTLDELKNMSAALREKTVLVVQDPFTSYYEASLVEACVQLIGKLGYHAVMLPFIPNGKAMHVKGFLNAFKEVAAKASAVYEEVHALGIAMVGVEPALVHTYRDEYIQALKEKRGNYVIFQIQEWLEQILSPSSSQPSMERQVWYLFGHCTESTASPRSVSQWMHVFKYLGLKLENVAVGCCGMAGTYGHEAEHKKQSAAIYDLSWREKIKSLPQKYCLATGFSCRSQVKRLENKKLRHPLEVVLEYIE